MLTQKEILIISLIWSGKSIRNIGSENNICRKTIKKVLHKYSITPFKQLMFEEGLVICTTCKVYKRTDLFYKGKDKVTMLESTCKDCKLEYERTPGRKNSSRKWRCENKLIKSESDKRWRNKNKEKIRNNRKKESYKIAKRVSDKKYYNRVLKIPKLNLSRKVKSAMSTSIRYSKANNYLKIVGYTIEDLQKHLENLFKDNMSWENYGRGGWHIDHIKPLVLFDLTKECEFKEAWGLNNLQPLWESENCSKGSLYEGVRHQQKNGGTAGDKRARG